MLASLPVFIISLHTILFDSSCLLCVCPCTAHSKRASMI